MRQYLGWTVDFANPPGAPAFCGPDSMSWRIFKNPAALAIGGVAAVLMEFADPRIRSGVWDHSTFRTDPVGRSRRTGMAAMIGVYAPQAVARRVIAGVTNMHARVAGATPTGETYRALDPDLLDWVHATAAYGFLHAYDRFVSPLTESQRRAFYAEGAPVAELYGVTNKVRSDADFEAMTARLAPRFEPHAIVRDFLAVIESGRTATGLPRSFHRAIARASVSLLQPAIRDTLQLGRAYDLGRTERAVLRAMAALADRVPVLSAPPAQACRRLGLPPDFLYRSPRAQQRLLQPVAAE